MPLFPALALAAAATLASHERGGLAAADRFWLRAGGWLYGVVTVGAALALAVAPFAYPGLIGAATALPVALAVIVGAVIVARRQIAEQVAPASRMLLVATPVLFLVLCWVVIPAAEPAMKIAKSIARTIEDEGPPGAAIYTQGYGEPSLVFYLNRPLDEPVFEMPQSEPDIAEVLAIIPRVILIATEDNFARTQALAGEVPFLVLARFQAVNANAGGTVQRIVVAVRVPASGG